MHIRCPHCRNPVEIVADRELADFSCPSCGSSFQLAGEDGTDTYRPGTCDAVGHFEFRERLGMGAFGTVWKAYDRELDRFVAVKLPRKGQLNAEETSQFLREARAAAQLNHPGIVGVHEVGVHGTDVYIVSDLVDGVTLTDWLTGYRPSASEAAELCLKVSEALQHAHERGVIHRDLKPGNIMLDRDGRPHLMDFGLAKREAGEITMTMDGQVLGTPAYMSPEQARGESHQVDRRSDIYSLGVILFEMLTGERPFRGNCRMLLHQVLTEEPPRPRSLDSGVPLDLQTICLRCLEKNPERRFSSARELADELQRYLSREPILSRPIGRVHRLWRWGRRNPAVALLTIGVGILLLTGAIASAVAAYHSERQAIALGRSVTALTRQRNLTNEALQESQRAAEAARRAAREAELQEHNARENLYVASMNMLPHSWDDRNVDRVALLLDRLRPGHGKKDLRGFEWFYWWDRAHRHSNEWLFDQLQVEDLSLSADGAKLAVSFNGSTAPVMLVDTQQGRVLEQIRPGSFVDRIEFLGDSDLLLVVTMDYRIGVWDIEAGELVCERKFQRRQGLSGSLRATVSDDGRFVGFHGSSGKLAPLLPEFSGRLLLLQTRDLEISHSLAVDQWVDCIAIAPDSREVVFTTRPPRTNRAQLHQWQLEGDRLTSAEVLPTGIGQIEFTPDAEFLIGRSSFSAEPVDYVFNSQTLKPIRSYPVETEDAFSVSRSTDLGRALQDCWLTFDRIWSSRDGEPRPMVRLFRDGEQPRSIVGDSKLRTVYSDTGKRGVKRWALDALVREDVLRTPEASGSSSGLNSVGLCGIATAGDGRRLAGIDSYCRLTVWDVATGKIELQKSHAKPEGLIGTVTAVPVAMSPDGRSVAFLSRRRDSIELVDIDSGETRQRFSGSRPNSIHPAFSAIAFEKDGRRLVTANLHSGEVELWDVESGQSLQRISTGLIRVEDVALTPDGRVIACGGLGQGVLLYEANTGKRLHELGNGEVKMHRAVAFSSDGRHVASVSDDLVHVWDVETGRQRWQFAGHSSSPQDVEFSPHDNSLVSFGLDGLRCWSLSTGEPVMHLPQARSRIGGRLLTFAPDGRYLAFIRDRDSVEFLEAPRQADRSDRSSLKLQP